MRLAWCLLPLGPRAGTARPTSRVWGAAEGDNASPAAPSRQPCTSPFSPPAEQMDGEMSLISVFAGLGLPGLAGSSVSLFSPLPAPFLLLGYKPIETSAQHRLNSSSQLYGPAAQTDRQKDSRGTSSILSQGLAALPRRLLWILPQGGNLEKG
ncbi:unnamed protein product [Caretta caretta]